MRTDDGGLTWRFLSFIGPEPAGYAIMPSSVRLSPRELVTTIRRQDPPRSWIDAYASHDDGLTWTFLSTPEPDTGEGNPPSLLQLPDNRLCLIYGSRREPFGIFARSSGDRGKTWGDADHPSRRRRRPRHRLRPLDRPARRQGRGGLLLSRSDGATRTWRRRSGSRKLVRLHPVGHRNNEHQDLLSSRRPRFSFWC